MRAPKSYTSTIDKLVDRITALIPDHPEILEMDSPWALFKVDGFNCNDLGPSLAQAMGALSKSKFDWNNRAEDDS